MRLSPILLLCAYLLIDLWYVQVWRSDLALWTHAANMAPLKPRPTSQLGGYLMLNGRVQEGLDHWYTALGLANQRHVPEWDRLQTQDALCGNVIRLMTAWRPEASFMLPGCGAR